MSWSDADYNALTEIKDVLAGGIGGQTIPVKPGWYMKHVMSYAPTPYQTNGADPRDVDDSTMRALRDIMEFDVHTLPVLGIRVDNSGNGAPVYVDQAYKSISTGLQLETQDEKMLGPFHRRYNRHTKSEVIRAIDQLAKYHVNEFHKYHMAMVSLGLVLRHDAIDPERGPRMMLSELKRILDRAGYWHPYPTRGVGRVGSDAWVISSTAGYRLDGDDAALIVNDDALWDGVKDDSIEFSRTIIPDKKLTKRTKKAGRVAR